MKPYPTKEMKELLEAICSIKDKKEAADFFRDLLTLAELEEFANRWQMVKLLMKGESYADIAKKLGVSTTTVTRVAHWLHHGTGGYNVVAKRFFSRNMRETHY